MSSQHGSLIIIRDHPTPSSSDTFFTDAASSVDHHHQLQTTQSLSVRKLEQFDIVSDGGRKYENLQIVCNEAINVDSECVKVEEEEGEMPIVRNGSSSSRSNGLHHHHHHGDSGSDKDKAMFNVSRVKKVELSEIPLATDICSSACTAATCK